VPPINVLVPIVWPAACSTAVAGAHWVNSPFADQTESFSGEFGATPSNLKRAVDFNRGNEDNEDRKA
jgi:hypothetical protein